MATTFNKPKTLQGLDVDERRAAFVNGGSGGTGSGLPAGGTADQVLVKIDAVDGNAEWRSNNSGVMGFAQRTSNQTLGSGTWESIGSTSVTFTAISGRRYAAYFSGGLDSNHGAEQVAYVGLYTTGGTQLQAVFGRLGAHGSGLDTFYGSGYFTSNSLSGSQSWEIRGFFTSGASNTFLAGATIPAQLLVLDVTDIGPTGPEGDPGPPGTSALSGVATVDLGYPASFSKTVNVVDANVTASSRMIVGWGLTTDADVNDGEMDSVSFHPKPKTGSFDLTVSSTQRLGGVFKVSYLLV